MKESGTEQLTAGIAAGWWQIGGARHHSKQTPCLIAIGLPAHPPLHHAPLRFFHSEGNMKELGTEQLCKSKSSAGGAQHSTSLLTKI